jgi:rare lipoprotein A
VKGRTYVPLKKWESYQEIGVASWYGGKFNGRTTANGERFDARRSLTAAHRTLPFNVWPRWIPPDRPLGARPDQRPRPVRAVA